MEKTNEEVVTKILSNHEIIERDYVEELFRGNRFYASNPKYDLSHYLNITEPEPNKYGDKYIFVK